MADFKDCSIGALNPLILLSRLCASDGTYRGMRIMKVTGTSKVEACGDHYTIAELRKKVVGIASDGIPAVRVWETDKVEGADLTECSTCATQFSEESIEKSWYVKTADGEVALKLWNIT